MKLCLKHFMRYSRKYAKYSHQSLLQLTLMRTHTIPIQLFVGADYRFLLTVYGMCGATPHYSCIFCKVAQSERLDMKTNWVIDMTIDEMEANVKVKKYGCVHKPLSNVDLTHVVPDELHILLRIIDKLISNIIKFMLYTRISLHVFRAAVSHLRVT